MFFNHILYFISVKTESQRGICDCFTEVVVHMTLELELEVDGKMWVGKVNE